MCARRPSGVVADVVTEAVVDQLEMVQISEQDAERTPEALVLVEPPGEHGLPEPAVADARERVTHRGVQQIGSALAAVAQGAVVVEGLDGTSHLARGVVQRGGGHAHGLAMAVLVVQVDVGLTLATIEDRRQQRAPIAAQDRSRLVAVIEDHVPAAAPQHLAGGKPRDPLGGAVPVEHAPIAVDEVDTVAEVLEQRGADLTVQADLLERLPLPLLVQAHG